MTEENKNEVAIFEQIRSNVQVAARDYYKVPMAIVIGKGSLARTESFGGKSLVENSQKVDLAIQNTNEFTAAGGIGIHHTSYSNTISKLKRLGF